MKGPLLASAFLLSPWVAGAQNFAVPSVTAEPAVLLTCLASGKNAGTCLGAMTLDCMAENDLGNNNLVERLCVIEELTVWRDLVQRENTTLRQRLSDRPASSQPDIFGDPAALADDVGDRWEQWAPRHCALERTVDGARDRRAITEDTCLRNLTAARYGRLSKLNDMLEAQ